MPVDEIEGDAWDRLAEIVKAPDPKAVMSGAMLDRMLEQTRAQDKRGHSPAIYALAYSSDPRAKARLHELAKKTNPNEAGVINFAITLSDALDRERCRQLPLLAYELAKSENSFERFLLIEYMARVHADDAVPVFIRHIESEDYFEAKLTCYQLIALRGNRQDIIALRAKIKNEKPILRCEEHKEYILLVFTGEKGRAPLIQSSYDVLEIIESRLSKMEAEKK
ncbi:MAG TPA: hypothetical protein PL033_06425 [Candidatus Brocadiia bacterium]|nr:hypothetical protein [Candidatus Brocadiia bacterium]